MGSSRKRKAYLKIGLPLISVALLSFLPPSFVVPFIESVQKAVQASDADDKSPR